MVQLWNGGGHHREHDEVVVGQTEPGEKRREKEPPLIRTRSAIHAEADDLAGQGHSDAEKIPVLKARTLKILTWAPIDDSIGWDQGFTKSMLV